MNEEIETKRFESPDERLDMKQHGDISIVKLADGTSGMRAIFEPGWTWEADEKPLLGNPDACPMRHIGYCVRGTLAVQMIESGRETHIRAGDFFDIPPRHHAHVDGAERVELILFAPPEAEH